MSIVITGRYLIIGAYDICREIIRTEILFKRGISIWISFTLAKHSVSFAQAFHLHMHFIVLLIIEH